MPSSIVLDSARDVIPGWRRSLRMLLGVLLLLGGCAGSSPPPASVRLPADAVEGAGDPTRAAIISTAYNLGNPSTLAGNPAEAARTIANYEYLTVEIPTGPRWVGFSPLVGVELRRGLQEVRNVVGIAAEAPAQPVVDALYGASRALRAGDAAAAGRFLSSPLFPAGGQATLARLANLPRLPQASFAASLAANEMNRQDQGGRPGIWPQ